jgi:hypothetical protein
MRDSLKDAQYFEKRYSKDLINLKDSIDDCLADQAELALHGNAYKGDIKASHLNVTIAYFYKLFSGYSLRVSKAELGKDLQILIQGFQGSWKGSYYIPMEFMLSIAIVFDARREEITPILGLLFEYDYRDLVLDTMAHHIDPSFGVRTDQLIIKKYSAKKAKIIQLAKTDKDKAVIALKVFLEKEWLGLHDGGLINNKSHLMEDKYRGYWSLDSAALVKMLGLNDDILKDCKYYPYDLLH